MSTDPQPSTPQERAGVPLVDHPTVGPEAAGTAPGRGRMVGRRVLVVGSGREDHGLDDPPPSNGQAISRLLGREGAAVACADVEPGRAEDSADQVRREGATAIGLKTDATSEGDVAQMVADAQEALGGLDGLVCNLGIGKGFGLEGTSVEDWDHVVATNLRSHFLCLKHCLPVLGAGASVVLVSSVAGLRSGSGIPSYDASKAALSGLMRHAAGEGAGKGVRVNSVAPGLIDTPLGRLATQFRPGRTSRLPFGRQGTPWEVAHATVFLLSGEASYISAHQLVVDGGLLQG